MNLMLGLRMALAGGREGVARMVLMAIGVAVGIVLLLLALCAMPIRQRHVDRLAWHRTTAQSPPTAPDGALWLAVTDRFEGRDVIRVHVAALGPRPPVPPGVRRLPGPGEVVLSPALARLIDQRPEDQLRQRFPGQVIGTIGGEGLIAPGELVGIVGRTPEEMEDVYGAYEIHGIEQPGERADLSPFYEVFIGLIAILIVGPVLVFVWMVSRIGGVRREQRFAAIRLAGAGRLQTAGLAAIETGGAAFAGILLGWLGFLAVRPIVAGEVTLGHGSPIFPQDFAVPAWQQALAVLVVLALAVSTTLVTLRPAQVTPLGVRQSSRRKPPRAWRVAPLPAGIFFMWYAARAGQGELDDLGLALNYLLSMIAPLSILVGLVLTGPWVCLWISRGLARLSGGAATAIVARRIEADPYTTFRAVSGAAVAMFVATVLGMFSANDRLSEPTGHNSRSVLDHGVVAVHVRGAPEDSLAPLLRREGVVVARLGAGDQVVVACTDLGRVTDLRCPLPPDLGEVDDTSAGIKAEQLFSLPYYDASAADGIFTPSGFAEPGPDFEKLPVQTLFIPTDGTRAAQERIRTLAAVTVPVSRGKTGEDLPPPAFLQAPAIDAVLPYAMAFVLLVTAASLTVSVINGIMERRRPFALLRASGVRLGQLRRVVLLETGIPLAVTMLVGVGVAMLFFYVMTPPGSWSVPSAGFLLGLGAGALAAFAVSLIALPLLDLATRHDSIRFE